MTAPKYFKDHAKTKQKSWFITQKKKESVRGIKQMTTSKYTVLSRQNTQRKYNTPKHTT